MLGRMERRSRRAQDLGTFCIALASFAPAVGCRPAGEPAPQAAPPATASAAPAAPGSASGEVTSSAPPAPPAIDWARYEGECVQVEGWAGGQKIGPLLIAPRGSVAVALSDPRGDQAWWALPSGARVRVTGTVTRRADLPVFIPKPGEPAVQGIPVPPGTDLEAARRRFVLERARVTVVRTPPEVEAALSAAVGKDVSLEGVVWSLNGHEWLNHDGVSIHLEGQEAFAAWHGLHGDAVALRGRLDRRRMPRLDQIVLKANPDLADAFVLAVRALEPAPERPITRCSNEP